MELAVETMRIVARIARKHGVAKAYLFGSFARGDSREDSDIDVLVEFQPGRSLFDLVRLERELTSALGRDVDVLTPGSLDAISRIARYIDGADRLRFLSDEEMQDAVIRRIEVIGEAVARLPNDLKKQYPDIPWQDIKDMQNKLIHDYGHVDSDLVWEVVRREMPRLANSISRVLHEYS